MREFEDYEIYKEKCKTCGCKNKLQTELLNRRKKIIGYKLTCCACGNTTEFIMEHTENGKRLGNKIEKYEGKAKCIQPSPCKRYECPLHPLYYKYNNKNKITNSSQHLGNDDANNYLGLELVSRDKFIL